MRSSMLLSIFLWFVVAQGSMIYRDKIKNYYKCWTHMNCISEGTMAQKMKSCMDMLKPEDVKFILAHLDENYYKIPNQTASDFLSKYCHVVGDGQKETFDKIMDGLKNVDEVTYGHPDQEGFRSRGRQSFNCVLSYLENNFPDDDCRVA